MLIKEKNETLNLAEKDLVKISATEPLLKERIENLNLAQKDVLKISEMRTNLKTDFKKMKKPDHLKAEYQKKLSELNTQLDEATTYLVNQYEEFNDYKATHDTSLEKEAALAPIKTQIEMVKEKLNHTLAKEEKIKLKDQLYDLKVEYQETKILYSKSMKNKFWWLISFISILAMGTLIFVLAFTVVNKNILDQPNGIAIVAIISVSLIVILVYLIYLSVVERKKWVLDREKPTLAVLLNSIWIFFLNSLGVGSFAVFTATFKKFRIFTDEKKIPTTLNTGIGSFFFGIATLSVLQMDVPTLLILIGVMVVGSFVGSLIVDKVNRKMLSLIMGIGLIIASVLVLLTMPQLQIFDADSASRWGFLGQGDWWRMMISAGMCFVIGIGVSVGIGTTAPTMVMAGLLGLQFAAVVPISQIGGGYCMQVNAYYAMRKNNYLPRTSWTMIVASVIANLIYFVLVWVLFKTVLHISIDDISMVLKWIGIFVIAYAGFTLLQSYFKLRRQPVVKKVPFKLNEFDLNNYSVNFLMNYRLKNQELHYPKVHW